MDIQAQDCRLEGVGGERETSWRKATHILTGVAVHAEGPATYGPQGKRRLMEMLQAAVNREMDNKLAQLR